MFYICLLLVLTQVLSLVALRRLWQKYSKNLQYQEKFKIASQNLGLGLFLYNRNKIEAFNNIDLKPSDNINNLLEKAIGFCKLEDSHETLTKGVVKGGKIYLASMELNLGSKVFELLPHLPFIACIIDKNFKIIEANRNYHDVAGKKEYCIFDESAIAKKSIDMSVCGELQHFKLYKASLPEEKYLLCAINETSEKILKQDLEENKEGHRQILDFVSIAISIFNKNQNLVFYNQAFIQLFQLEEEFLEEGPSHSALLERLKEAHQLPACEEWTAWRQELFAVYSSLEPQQHKWNLPKGISLHVIAKPQPQGGVCWIYENLTPLLEMQLRYNRLIAHQGDTLDNLLEGIVLFDSNGKLLLSNPAFTRLWGLGAEFGVQGTHINFLLDQFKALAHPSPMFENLPGYITGFTEIRDIIKGQLELKDGRVLEYNLCPMSAGQNMLLFLDITAKMMIQRVLAEKNEALLLADKLRNEFVRHVSYDLLTPLTSIGGFSGLALETLDKKEKTREYLEDISEEAQKLNHMIQDMIDLASLNSGIIQLEVAEINLNALISQAYEKAQTNLRANNVGFNVTYEIEQDFCFGGDKKRLIQLLNNILSYCAMHSQHNKIIELKVNNINKLLYLEFSMHELLQPEVAGEIRLPLAQSICKLWHGNLEFRRNEQGESIICSLPSLL